MDIANKNNGKYEFVPVCQPSIYVCKNRNNVGARFIVNTDCDYLLMLDADNGIRYEHLDYFMEDFEDPDVNIVTGKYYYKDPEPHKAGLMVVGYVPPECTKNFHASLPEQAFSEPLVNVTKAMGRAVVGCGCLMVSRFALDNIEYPWFVTDWVTDDTGTTMVGEDLYFAYKAQDSGFDIYFDQRIESPHYSGSKCYPPEWDQIP
jgi:GT2 family glycosyltransferase